MFKRRAIEPYAEFFRKIFPDLNEIRDKINGLEAISHGSRATYVGNNRVLTKAVVEGRNIAFFVEADDLLLSPWFIVSGKYETDLTDYFVKELKPNSHSIDVGSNFGYFTCLFARFSPQGKIVGIEADKKIYEMARDNVLINGFNGFATMVNAACGDSNDDVMLYRRFNRSGNTSISKADAHFLETIGEPESETFNVKGVRVDDFLHGLGGVVDFIKIDVEGAEPLVVQGARTTIEANPNVQILMEWSPGQIQHAGFDLPAFMSDLEKMNLEAFDIIDNKTKSVSWDELLNIPYRTAVLLKSKKASRKN